MSGNTPCWIACRVPLLWRGSSGTSFLVSGMWSTLKEHRNPSSMYWKPHGNLTCLRTHVMHLKRWYPLCHQGWPTSNQLVMTVWSAVWKVIWRPNSPTTGAVSHNYGTFGMILSFLVLLTSNYYFSLHFLISLKTQGKGNLVGGGSVGLGPLQFQQWRWPYICVILWQFVRCLL